jgi:hypothetical protein
MLRCDGDLGCLDTAVAGGYLVLAGWNLGHGALGMALPAGILKGRYDATAHHLDGRSPRDGAKFVRWGGAGIGVGAALGLVNAIAPNLDSCSADACLPLFVVGTQLGWAVAGVGTGLLSYGLAYRSRVSDLPRAVSLRIVPSAARGYGGLSLAGVSSPQKELLLRSPGHRPERIP